MHFLSIRTCIKTMFSFCFLLPLALSGQPPAAPCVTYQSGSFHSYPINSNQHFLIQRDGTTQKERNTQTGDSIIWKLNWTNDCTYTLNYVKSSKLKREELDFLRKYTFIYEITQRHADYYIFTGYLDSKKNTPFQIDTFWLKQKAVTPNNLLFIPIEPTAVRRARFSDTSSYALVYIYRSKKVKCMLADYVVNANNYAMCVAKNNNSYVFKIMKEGPLNLWAKNDNRESKMEINIKFGQKYYVASETLWNLGVGCNPELKLKKPEIGQLEFESIL